MEGVIKKKQTKKRRFLGKTSNFSNKEERNFEKAHLKAYLKGGKFFYHGFEGELNNRFKKSNIVLQEFYYV